MAHPVSSTKTLGNRIVPTSLDKGAPIRGGDPPFGQQLPENRYLQNACEVFSNRLDHQLTPLIVRIKMISIAVALVIPVCIGILSLITWNIILTGKLASELGVHVDDQHATTNSSNLSCPVVSCNASTCNNDVDDKYVTTYSSNFSCPVVSCNASTCNNGEEDHKPNDCLGVLAANKSADSGVYSIYPHCTSQTNSSLSVYCDMSTRDGGWIVFQRRKDGSENFARHWVDYKNGFGTVGGEFWLGLDNIHDLVSCGTWELLINMTDNSAGSRYALYEEFYIASEDKAYLLNIGKYTGNAGDMMKHHNARKFSTKDRDNDVWFSNCAGGTNGGWWMVDCWLSALNRHYGGIEWYQFSSSIEFVEMKIRQMAIG